MVRTSEKRKVMSQEELAQRFLSPVVFYGHTTAHRWALCEDPNGKIIRDNKCYSLKKVVTDVHHAECQSQEQALAKLRTTYDWWVATHQSARYWPFEDCIRFSEPLCKREFPDLHGVYLLMIPRKSAAR